VFSILKEGPNPESSAANYKKPLETLMALGFANSAAIRPATGTDLAFPLTHKNEA
jgi:hypothetical protein